MKKLIALAIILRVLVAAFYFHPDIKTYSYQASFLTKGVFNIYTYLVQNNKALPLKDDFVYFPLTYFTLGGYQVLISPLLGSHFINWVSSADVSSFASDPSIFKYLILLKLPYLILDITIAFLLKEYFDDRTKADKAFKLWLFNPFTIILVYVYSNVDIIPVALTLVSLLYIKKEKLSLASLMLGIAAGFKLYPLLLVPFLVLKAKTASERWQLLLIPFGVFALITLPFASGAFVQSALVSGLTTRIFNPGPPIGFNESIILSLVGITILFFYAYLVDKKIDIFNYWTVLLIIIFSFSHFHVQWLLWVAPFLAILAIEKPKLSLSLFFLAAVSLAIPLLYDDRSMTISLLRGYSTWYDLLPTPFAILQRFYDPYNMQSILHSVLAAGNLLVIYKIFEKKVEI